MVGGAGVAGELAVIGQVGTCLNTFSTHKAVLTNLNVATGLDQVVAVVLRGTDCCTTVIECQITGLNIDVQAPAAATTFADLTATSEFKVPGSGSQVQVACVVAGVTDAGTGCDDDFAAAVADVQVTASAAFTNLALAAWGAVVTEFQVPTGLDVDIARITFADGDDAGGGAVTT